MRFRFAVLVAVTSFLTVLSPAHAAPRPTAIHTAAIDSAFDLVAHVERNNGRRVLNTIAQPSERGKDALHRA